MKKILCLLAVLFATATVHAIAVDEQEFSPFRPKVIRAINALQELPGNASYAESSALRLAVDTYDVTVDGGGVGAHGLGTIIPAGSIIKQAWFYTDVQFVDSGSGTVALHCEDANNIYSAADVTGITVGTITSGVSTGTAANMRAAIAQDCELTATVATAAQSAGKMTIYVEYVLH